jgi:uncharacterized protein YqjF (DUF2071 family)
MIMIAPDGKSSNSERNNPTTVAATPMIIELTVILKNRFDINLAEAAGMTKKAAISTIPTNLIDRTIVTAIRIERR